jgi:hypothetical protein
MEREPIHQPNAIDTAVHRLEQTVGDAFRGTHAGRHAQMRTPRALSAIHSVAHRLAYAAWMRNDAERLMDGLILEAFADSGLDYRDTMVRIAPFHRQATFMGLDVPAFFDRVAERCPLPEVSRTLRVFGPRTDIDEGGGWPTFAWMRPHEVVD